MEQPAPSRRRPRRPVRPGRRAGAVPNAPEAGCPCPLRRARPPQEKPPGPSGRERPCAACSCSFCCPASGGSRRGPSGRRGGRTPPGFLLPPQKSGGRRPGRPGHAKSSWTITRSPRRRSWSPCCRPTRPAGPNTAGPWRRFRAHRRPGDPPQGLQGKLRPAHRRRGHRGVPPDPNPGPGGLGRLGRRLPVGRPSHRAPASHGGGHRRFGTRPPSRPAGFAEEESRRDLEEVRQAWTQTRSQLDACRGPPGPPWGTGCGWKPKKRPSRTGYPVWSSGMPRPSRSGRFGAGAAGSAKPLRPQNRSRGREILSSLTPGPVRPASSGPGSLPVRRSRR